MSDNLEYKCKTGKSGGILIEMMSKKYLKDINNVFFGMKVEDFKMVSRCSGSPGKGAAERAYI